MKKSFLLAIATVLVGTNLMAGGIMTNTNQSASYARMFARNASLSLDGVYYNPAGLTKQKNGFYLSLNNQSIFQTKTITSNYPYLNSESGQDAKYTGKVTAPLFPGVYAVYKRNKLAFSFGVNPVGGGGGAKYDTGLPSFEMPVSDLVPALGPKFGVTQYQADINFEGTSVYWGFQAGVSYEINSSLSLFAGVRYVTAKNTYKGSITDIMINPNYTAPAIPDLTPPSFNGDFMRADEFGTTMNTYFTDGSAYYTEYAANLASASTLYGGAATQLGSLITQTGGAAGNMTADECVTAGFMTAQQAAQYKGGLALIGMPATSTISQGQAGFQTTSNQAAAGSAQATAGAAQLSGAAVQMGAVAAGTGNKEVDVTQTGNGYTPILGANLTLGEKLTIAVKYEFLTKIELTNQTVVDGTGEFPDGATTRADMPAMLSIGASYPLNDKLTGSISMNYFFDKNADYGKKDSEGISMPNDAVIDKNSYEMAFGLEYNITEKFLVSAGYLFAHFGVTEDYQSDLGFILSTNNSLAFGGKYQITDGIGLNLGAFYSKYVPGTKTYDHMLGANSIPVTETYEKLNWALSVGLDIKIGK